MIISLLDIIWTKNVKSFHVGYVCGEAFDSSLFRVTLESVRGESVISLDFLFISSLIKSYLKGKHGQETLQ